MTTAREKMTARIAGLGDRMLIEGYEISARIFATDPRHPDAGAHELILSIMDMEMLKRPHIPCCPECSVPLSVDFHIRQLHDPAVAAVADALLDAGAAAVATPKTVVTVTRYQQQPAAPGRRGPTGWAYHYTVDDGPLCQYGPGLASLRAILKRKHPDAAIVLTWKATA